MKKEVLFITGSMGRGGAERVISILTNELVNRGWKVHIATILSGKVGYDLNPVIDLIDLSNEKMNQLLDTPRMIRAIRKVVKEIKPDAVISFMLTINIVTWLAAMGLNIRFIPSERNDPSTGRSKLKHWLSCRAYANSYRTVFQTERAKSYFPKSVQQKGVIIPNPVKVDEFYIPTGNHKIVSVGRLELQKNKKLLIEAFYDVYKNHSEYSLHIYGEGTQEGELRQLIGKLGLDDKVFMHGNVNDVHKQISDAEIFVLSSDYEGLSNALLEAMMMGLPCVTTDCAGATDAVENGVDGIIVPIRDRKKLAAAMEKLISDENMRNQFSQKAIEHSKKFSVDNVVNQWEDIIAE